MSPEEWFGAFRRAWVGMTAVFLLSVLASTAVLVFTPPTYEAEAEIVFSAGDTRETFVPRTVASNAAVRARSESVLAPDRRGLRRIAERTRRPRLRNVASGDLDHRGDRLAHGPSDGGGHGDRDRRVRGGAGRIRRQRGDVRSGDAGGARPAARGDRAPGGGHSSAWRWPSHTPVSAS
ncbi:hypothetical protein JM654_21905 [Microbacterium oxydans]|nr:hypothetical protein [Microbacterium oxydans]